jgi:hypothetical protein
MLTLSLLLVMSAEAPATALTPSAPPMTRQQAFDAASKLAEEGKCAAAVAAFDALEARLTAKGGELVKAAVSVRKGTCLASLGRFEEAEPHMRAGIGKVAAGGPDFAAEAHRTLLMLGGLAQRRLDYDRAQADLLASLTVAATPANRFASLLRLSTITAFDPGEEPLSYTLEAFKLAESFDKADRKRAMAIAKSAQGRILLNRGLAKQGYAALKEALNLQGGLDLKVSLAEIDTRFDLATAAIVSGNENEAPMYLAYTGAGRFEDAPFATAENMELPYCGQVEGLTADRVAVVSFVIDDDGRVSQTTPVYSNGSRTVALAFAASVREWTWRPSDVAKIESFFRTGTRVELRCTNSAQGRADVSGLLSKPYAQWRDSVTPKGAPWVGSVVKVDVLRTELNVTDAGPSAAKRIILLQSLADHPEVNLQQSRLYASEARDLAHATKLPAAVLLSLDMQVIDLQNRQKRDRRSAALKLLGEPYLADQPQLLNAFRLLLGRGWFRSSQIAESEALLLAIGQDSRLTGEDPLRTAALLELASLTAHKGNLAKASEYFKSTGLTEEQCSLLGLSPRMRDGLAASDYPTTLTNLGMSSWIKMEFDVEADGRTINPRSLVSYPPFALSQHVGALTRSLRYQSSFRPNGSTACAAQSFTQSFRVIH